MVIRDSPDDLVKGNLLLQWAAAWGSHGGGGDTKRPINTGGRQKGMKRGLRDGGVEQEEMVEKGMEEVDRGGRVEGWRGDGVLFCGRHLHTTERLEAEPPAEGKLAFSICSPTRPPWSFTHSSAASLSLSISTIHHPFALPLYNPPHPPQ